jgi:hypothetical protein
MEFPDDVLNIIKEYSRPCWRKGSYINRSYKNAYTLLEDLQIHIVQKWFSYDRLFHLNLEYKLLEESRKYRNMQTGIAGSFEIRKRGIKEDIEETLQMSEKANKEVESRRRWLTMRSIMRNYRI